MKYFLILISLTFVTFNVLAIDSYGARYLGQGNAMVASANDAFALKTSPANLIPHFGNNNSELAINFTQLSEEPDSLSGIQFFGGYFSSNNFVLGGYYNQENSPSYIGNTEKNTDVVISEAYGLSFAWGNDVLDLDTTFVWGVGGSVEAITSWLEEDDNQEIGQEEYGYNVGGKVGYTGQVNFDTWAVDSFVNLALNHQSEVINKGNNYGDVTIRPESNSAGLMVELSLLTQNYFWQVRASLEGKKVNTEESNFNQRNKYFYKDETKLGVELSLDKISLRAGLNKIGNTTFSSVGVGYLFEKWSVDIALADSYFGIDEQLYSLSFTRQIGK